jgi:anti-anti-sigma factor
MLPDEQFAEAIWEMLETQFTRRVVLEVDELRALPSWLVGQLVKLHKRVHSSGGMLRLCGLSDTNQAVLQTSRLDDRFPQYRDRREALMGRRPTKPR